MYFERAYLKRRHVVDASGDGFFTAVAKFFDGVITCRFEAQTGYCPLDL